MNGLLELYWSKSTDFKRVLYSEVKEVIVNLNDRARKKLKYKTLTKLMAAYMVAIAAKRLCTSGLNLPLCIRNKFSFHRL